MESWKRKDVPEICERLLGFSVPHDDKILVVSYEGMHLLTVGESVTVEHDDEYADYDLYDHNTGIAKYRDVDYKIIGLYEGSPLLTSPSNEELILDTNSETLWVKRYSQVLFQEKYQNFSGDWAAVTFSPDGNYIVLGCPYDFDFRIWERAPGAGPTYGV